MDVVDVKGCRLHLMAVVRGLASEAAVVEAAVAEVAPEAVALSLSREEIEALRAHDGSEVPPENVDEEVYVQIGSAPNPQSAIPSLALIIQSSVRPSTGR